MCVLSWGDCFPVGPVLLKPNCAFPDSLEMPVTFPPPSTVTCHPQAGTYFMKSELSACRNTNACSTLSRAEHKGMRDAHFGDCMSHLIAAAILLIVTSLLTGNLDYLNLIPSDKSTIDNLCCV